ncbi:unnamed protein product [Rhodiola kirilowii]
MEFSRADAVAVWYDIIIFTQIQLISYGDLEICCERGLCLDSEKGAGFAPAEILNAVVRRLADQKMDLAAEIFAGLSTSAAGVIWKLGMDCWGGAGVVGGGGAMAGFTRRVVTGGEGGYVSSCHICDVDWLGWSGRLLFCWTSLKKRGRRSMDDLMVVSELPQLFDHPGTLDDEELVRSSAMSFILRRLASKSATSIVIRRTSILQSRSVACLPNHCSQIHPPPPALDSLTITRRGFAKRKSSKDSGDEDMVDINLAPNAKAAAISLMEAALTALSQQLSKLRTGRASVGMLDHIIVETGGVKVPLNGVAMVSAIDAKTLSVTPYDSNALKEIENAIVTSPLGLNPKVDGERLIAVIPPLTKEHIQAVCKVVSKSSEEVKQSIRRARQKALDTVKKAGSGFPKDEAKRFEKEVDDLTKKYIKSAEEMCKSKEKEILQG